MCGVPSSPSSSFHYSVSVILSRWTRRRGCPPAVMAEQVGKKTEKKWRENQAGRGGRQFPQRSQRKTAVFERYSSPAAWSSLPSFSLPQAPGVSPFPPFFSFFFFFPASSHKRRCCPLCTHNLKHHIPPQKLSPKPGTAKGRSSHSYAGHTLHGSATNRRLAV